jgi:hypothetical protein
METTQRTSLYLYLKVQNYHFSENIRAEQVLPGGSGVGGMGEGGRWLK